MIYTSRYINLISFLITMIIFSVIDLFSLKLQQEEIPKISDIIPKNQNIKKEVKNLNETNNEIGNWYIEIPSIGLKAPIQEGTDMETLNTKVGHFEETSVQDGNIGLAAHNRGYEYNYFENLKNTKINDEIIYTNNNYKKIYLIDKIEIIKNTDWSYLNKTDENKITLITCVENEPNYRRCVQATEK